MTGETEGTVLGRWGRFVGRHAGIVLVLWLVALAGAAAYGGNVVDRLGTQGDYDESADSWHSYELLQRDFRDASPDITVVYSSDTLTVADPQFRDAVRAVVAGLPPRLVPKVVNGLDTPASMGLVSPDGHAVQVWVSLPTAEVDKVFAAYREVRPLLSAKGIRTDLAGLVPMGEDVTSGFSRDSAHAEALALPAVALLSLFVFGSVVSALLPSLVGAVAVVVALATLRVATEITTVASYALMVVSLLGLGLAIDYTLFVVTRFREELGGRRGRAAAVAAMGPTMATAGRTVIVSAFIVATSMAGLLVFPLIGIHSIAYGAIPAVLGAMVAAVTLLPAVLVLLSHRVDAWRLPWTARHAIVGTAADDPGVWSRVAYRVMRRPWTYLVAVSTLLLALAAPFLGVRWGSADEQLLPADAPSRVAQQAYAQHFGGTQTWGYVMVEGATPASTTDYLGALATVPGVTRVTVLGTNPTSGVTFASLTWAGTAQSESSQQMVRSLRAVPVTGAGAAYLGGPSALTVDQLHLVGQRLPWMLVAVAGSMFLLLGAAFRSILLPLKAIVTTLVSITASYGVVTWVFQDGHLSGMLGFDPPGYLEVSTPIIMAAILFGLSMDYEVFLLSRVKEEWDRTGDNTLAVAHGLARTGRIITGAALLLGVVIGAFVSSGIVIAKMIGLGMLVAVLLDATVVRGLLVPAAMRLLGRWNWWLPSVRRRV